MFSAYFDQVHKDAKKHLTRDVVDLQIAFLFFHREASYSTKDSMPIKTALYYHITKEVSYFNDVSL